MLILLALPVIAAVAALHRYLQSYAPMNLLIRRVRVQEPRWRIVAALVALAAALFGAMHVLAEMVAKGAPGWLNLAVIVLAWDAVKVALLGCQVVWRSLSRLICARHSRPAATPRRCA